MQIQVKGEDYTLEFNFKAIKAITKLLGCPKIADLEKALNNVGYDNAANIAHAALKANGVDVKASDIEESIEDAGFPVSLATAIAQAIAPEQTELINDVAAGN